MNFASLPRKATAWALALGCALAFVRCADDQVAGSSVTTGNPTEIQVSLTDAGGGPVALSGRVEIYAATQIPVPGFRPDPLARFDLPGQSTFTLNSGHFDGIADSLWSKGSLEGDSLARFNLVISGTEKGSILRDLAFRLKDGKFMLKPGTFKSGRGGAVEIPAAVAAFTEYQASIDASALSSAKNHYLFLYGTGYFASAEKGVFRFPAMPAGTYQPALLSLPTKESQSSSPQDSANVYALDKALSTEPTQAARGEILERVPVPADLR